MNSLRKELPLLPRRMRNLPVDDRGYPVPWFVSWINGKPDFRVADGLKIRQAIYHGNCWVCGEKVGKFKTFVIGPMCAINRVSAEPPCHRECAEFSAVACPFLRLPKAQRRETNIPQEAISPAGEMIHRNPGVTLLWTTVSYSLMRVENGVLFNIGDPIDVKWYAESRQATRAKVMESIDSGYPILEEMARKESTYAIEQLTQQKLAALQLVPL